MIPSIARGGLLLLCASLLFAITAQGTERRIDAAPTMLDHMLWLTLQSTVHLELALEGAGRRYLKEEVNVSEEGIKALYPYTQTSSSTLALHLEQAFQEFCVQSDTVNSVESLSLKVAEIDKNYRSTLHQIITGALAIISPSDRDNLVRHAASSVSSAQVIATDHDEIFETFTDEAVPALIDDLCAEVA